MSRPGGLSLSPTQIIASLLATLTGAVLASYLGVGGTLAGAAVGSIASTTGTEVYRHYLRRSQERLKAAGEVLRSRQTGTGEHTGHAAGQPHGPAPAGDAATETLAASRAARGAGGLGPGGPGVGRYNGRGPDTSPDATETQVIPAVTSQRAQRPGAGTAGHTAGRHASGELNAGTGPDGAAPGGGPWWRNISRRQWLAYGGVTLGVFLAVMVVVTIIELSAGKPLDAAVWGRHATGTSVGTLMGGGGQHKQPAGPHATSTPTTQSSGSTGASSSPASTPSATAPSPTTSPSSVPSSAPAATPTPGSGQGSAQAVTPTP